MQPKWIRWEPIKELSGKYYLKQIVWLKNQLKIVLYSEKDAKKNKVLELLFDRPIGSFRVIDESYCYKIVNELEANYTIDFYQNWSFFKIINSEYNNWTPRISSKCKNDSSIIHYCFLGQHEGIDIASKKEPQINLMSESI